MWAFVGRHTGHAVRSFTRLPQLVALPSNTRRLLLALRHRVLVSALLTGVLVFLVGTAAAGASSEQMVYERVGCIYSASITGTGEVQLTCGWGNLDAQNAVLSPDGQTAAFANFYCGIGTVSLATHQVTRVVDDLNPTTGNCSNDDYNPHWTPDGKSIVFDRSVAGTTSGRDIWIVNADGSGLHPLISWPGNQTNPVISPDGTKVAFASDTSPTGRALKSTYVYVANASTGANPVQLAAGTPFAFSPDGSKIAYNVNSKSGTDIYTMTTSGGNKTWVTSTGLAAGGAWSPDGSEILYTRYVPLTRATHTYNIYEITPSGTNDTGLVTGSTYVANPSTRQPRSP
jgi:Tol biopolymer transport system component